MNFCSGRHVNHRVMRLERRIARYQRRMLRHQDRMLKHQRRLNRVLGGASPGVHAMMQRTFGSAGVFGPAGVFGSAGVFGRRGMFGHRGPFGHYGMVGMGRGRGMWRRRSRRLFPVLLGLLLVGIATAVMAAKGERSGPGNWVSV
jgi:hypothetical protein